MSVQITEQDFYDMRAQRDNERTKNLTLQIELARLTAANESMQEDAVQNTCAFNLMLTANKAQAEEIRTLKGLLENSRIALTFYREWMFSHAETRYPFGHEIESEIALKLSGES